MSGANGTSAASGAAPDASALGAWRAVRGAADIQYAPLAPPAPPQDPAWLKALVEALKAMFEPIGRALGMSWPVLEQLLLWLAAAGAAWIAWRLLRRLRALRRQRRAAAPENWAPTRAEALALLEDADLLAAAGRYDEATHLLLRRSVGQIAAVRPDWLHPASTAREIARLPALPAPAREAFALIAERVERCVFALLPLGPEDWQAARAAYARFAAAELRP